ncbi:methyl-accepting chemotaxis protein [Geobacter sp. DSM 9736]|uniref:methyl-accepting chemotaxis protein n=1 Tax=Geobacter sp. DSM 9736 TaxID=1277350 RepID=UPI000B50B3A3|nr:methyl-accepting chemotaxis protein [Geobacter sp. DSM 9736]SNB46854.1 methyl-accepting chemotaxis protein [Geobacter sp. DSM 9736]
MTIKGKLTLNVVIVMVIIAAVAATSIIGMGFVKSKLHYLTQRSTPFQIRTIEFQRAIQGVTGDLTKVGASKNAQEFKTFRAEAEKSLAEVLETQKTLETISGTTRSTHEELTAIANELFSITEGRLKAEDDAVTANRTISQKLGETGSRLRELDGKIKGLQSSTSNSYVKSVDKTRDVTSRVRSLELLRLTLKDFQLGFFEVQKAQSKKGVLIAQGKINAAVNKANQNEFLKTSEAVAGDIRFLATKAAELIKLQSSVVGQAGADTGSRDALVTELNEKLNSVILVVEQEVTIAGERMGVETGNQSGLFSNSNAATGVLVGNSELVALGLTVEGLATRLFTVRSSKEVDAVEAELRKTLGRVGTVAGNLENSLRKLNAKGELRILQNSVAALNSIRDILMVKDGVIGKIRHQLLMNEKALAATGKLREIVLKQAEEGKQTVSTAQGDQEKAISTVNKMVRFSILLIAAISIGAVLFGVGFGTWVYRSISTPLHALQKISEDVAGGNLGVNITASSKDEISAVQRSMATMIDNLRNMVGKIKEATNSLASSAEELSATAVTVEQGTEEQSARMEQSSAAMTEMAQTTTEVAQNSLDTSTAAVKMSEIASHGKDAMHSTVAELNKFAETVKEAADKVESLGQQSEQISEVVSLIKDIADQTNLLALNAAIEAARAGEQGRGFAVVADEVRALAEKTAAATDEISRTVSSMQGSVSESVEFMKDERESVGKVLDHVNNTLQSIDEIVNYVSRVTDMVQRIAVAAEQQSSSTDDISNNMESIANIARELRHSCGDIKGSSENLSKLAVELNGMVAWFRV